jgi:hypothetical protein
MFIGCFFYIFGSSRPSCTPCFKFSSIITPKAEHQQQLSLPLAEEQSSFHPCYIGLVEEGLGCGDLLGNER